MSEFHQLGFFTINSAGEVHIELLQRSGHRSSYVYMNELVDHFFPPIEVSTRDEVSSFTDVNFWRSPLPELSDEEEDDTNKSTSKSPKTPKNTKFGYQEFEGIDEEDAQDYSPSPLIKSFNELMFEGEEGEEGEEDVENAV